MAVESRFVVIRQGVEVETFMDKKAADEYDKMLDMADNLSEMFKSVPFELSEEIKEDLSIYLAQNRENVLVELQEKKAAPVKKTNPVKKADAQSDVGQASTENITPVKTESPKKVKKTVEKASN